jgi:hypothetical protein
MDRELSKCRHDLALILVTWCDLSFCNMTIISCVRVLESASVYLCRLSIKALFLKLRSSLPITIACMGNISVRFLVANATRNTHTSTSEYRYLKFCL